LDFRNNFTKNNRANIDVNIFNESFQLKRMSFSILVRIYLNKIESDYHVLVETSR